MCTLSGPPDGDLRLLGDAAPPSPPPLGAYVKEGSRGCRHYRRRCRIVAPCCGEAFWCRHCHNEAKRSGASGGPAAPAAAGDSASSSSSLSSSSSSARPDGACEASHELDRRRICEVICQRCLERQPPDQKCGSCGQVFGAYFCGACNFWDDEGIKKQVFHCRRCGICRVGGRENYFHCDTCDSCYPNEIRTSHTCVENAMHQNCPVCLLDLFQSTLQVTILQCGHTMHQACLRELQTSFAGLQSLRCPICSASLYKYADLWAEMDRQVEETPMPPEYRDLLTSIVCNDCQSNSMVPFHVLGHKCASCKSYNTRRL